jgi:hypothetical protein
VADRPTPREDLIAATLCSLGLPFLGIPDTIFHSDTATFQITLQVPADDESLKFLMSGSFFYVWMLAFCWSGDKLSEQVVYILIEQLYRELLFLRLWQSSFQHTNLLMGCK